MSVRPWPYWMHSVAYDPSAIVFFFVVVCEVVPTGWTDLWWISHSSWWALRTLWAAELCCFSMMSWNYCLWAGDTLRRCGVPIFHGRCRPASPGRVSLGQYPGSGNGLLPFLLGPVCHLGRHRCWRFPVRFFQLSVEILLVLQILQIQCVLYWNRPICVLIVVEFPGIFV